MKKTAWIGIGLLACTLGSGCTEVEYGSGYSETVTQRLDDFEEVNVHSIHGTVIVEVCECLPQVRIEADDNLIDDIHVDVAPRDDDSGPPTLFVSVDERIEPSAPLSVHVRTPPMNHVSARGAHDFELRGRNGGDARITVGGSTRLDVTGRLTDLEVDLEGSSTLEARELDVFSLDLRQTSSSTARIAGEAAELKVVLRGSSRLDAETLTTQKLEAKLRGSSRADVCVTEDLEASLKHSTTLAYWCDPLRSEIDKRDSSRVVEVEGTPVLQKAAPVVE